MKVSTHVFATGLKGLAVAIPFLFAYTQPPMSNFWPLVASAMCGWLIVMLSITGSNDLSALRKELAGSLALGLIVAGVLASIVGLIQFFKGDVGWSPWIYQSTMGQAIGNLRQRNQQATLLVMSALALVLISARLLRNGSVPGRPGSLPLLPVFAVLLPWTMALLAMGTGVTASRTAALEWLGIVILLWCWRKSLGRLAFFIGLGGLLAYLFVSWLLPELLLRWSGVQMDGLFMRVADTSHRCTSRVTLWSNMLYLIGQKPWLGWGWGELDFAHYSTLFPGERFCVLLDNAHNLPLHLAVELGLPVALAFCALVLWAVWRFKPWRESDPARQLCWGILLLVGMHSILEFPLWYGPFQLVTVLALVILLLPRDAQVLAPAQALVLRGLMLAACLVWLAGAYVIASDFERMAQLYQAPAHRKAQWRDLTASEVSKTTYFFENPADFAWLTTTKVNDLNASQMHAMAARLLHYSPEPRVISKLIESAQRLGLQDEVQQQKKRFEIAYPDAYKTFEAKQASEVVTTAVTASQ